MMTNGDFLVAIAVLFVASVVKASVVFRRHASNARDKLSKPLAAYEKRLLWPCVGGVNCINEFENDLDNGDLLPIITLSMALVYALTTIKHCCWLVITAQLQIISLEEHYYHEYSTCER